MVPNLDIATWPHSFLHTCQHEHMFFGAPLNYNIKVILLTSYVTKNMISTMTNSAHVVMPQQSPMKQSPLNSYYNFVQLIL